ncbi:hypothetical protein GUJ93_ZPchr0011g27488 [Zizania palustris]|uniref:Uncharacterized protein n=1 Tax=Zizania palustris TaxID=103762 RepID=A0A8J5WHR1_ZIZPA|nr:hypothetical protein GUJ93_ZPchr0011g27488 [Zizania palustris]KAG8090425.1 hypothetical protein GUJ93_ZPchr0011g27488 [Zizania palustris]
MATILDTLVGSCINKLGEIITDNAILILGVQEELKELQRRAYIIQSSLNLAEPFRMEESEVAKWFGQLRDVMYDIDDIIDLARFKGSLLLPDHPLSSSSKSTNCFGLSLSSRFYHIRACHEVALKIRSLDKKIESISKDKVFFELMSTHTRNGSVWTPSKTTNLVEPNLVGKKVVQDSRELVDLVLKHNRNKVYKIAIVGIGGVGKTTLAQKIFNDAKIKERFNKLVWVCVSRDYSEESLLREVLQQMNVALEQNESLAVLQSKLKSTIEDKSFFLVLDDVWKYDTWTRLLRVPLHTASTGIVVVTTRQDTISLEIGADHTHRVDLMEVDEGWELLWKSMNINEEKKVRHLRDIGIEIVRGCGGLPLAITVIATVLASKGEEENEWRKRSRWLHLLHNWLDISNLSVILQRQAEEENQPAFHTKKTEPPTFLPVLKTSCLSIPSYISNLIHLRLLDLDGSNISCLPESIGVLQNLQILNLQNCNDLHNLPLAITKLCNLRRLGLEGTPITKVPVGIGNLEFLNDLEGFPIGGRSDNTTTLDGWNLEELEHLSQLRNLHMIKLERASPCSSMGSLLIDKKHLKVLRLCCSERMDEVCSDEGVCNIEMLFENLTPPHNLEDLYIEGFFGRRYPTWLGSTHLYSLKYMFLVDCKSFLHLPPIGHLPRLKFLKVQGATNVTKIGPQFLSCFEGNLTPKETVAFPQLEWLVIEDMPNWEEWSFVEGHEQLPTMQMLPCLKKVNLLDCPKLRGLPPQFGHEANSLELLYIKGANCLKTVDDFPFLSTTFCITECEGLERVSNLPQVRGLYLYDCPNLRCVEEVGNFERLFLDECMKDNPRGWVNGLLEQGRQRLGDDLDVYMKPS